MSIAEAERLKRQLTDKYVVVAEGIPELRRFHDLTGVVKTVNMSGQALVEFQGREDIGWYDIDPAWLTVVEKPLPKKQPAAAAPQAEARPAGQPAAKKPAGKSPLEMARQQDAAGASAAKPAGKKLSPLEQARRQDAARAQGGGETAPAAAAEQAESKPAEPPKPAGRKLSPLERARQQDSGQS